MNNCFYDCCFCYSSLTEIVEEKNEAVKIKCLDCEKTFEVNKI